jgi:death-on-curing protein
VDPLFLALDEVLVLHNVQVRSFGGSAAIRDLGPLASAMGNAEATFDGQLFHPTLCEMAAAYLYGICRNRPFVDGNKRTAAVAALTFLDMNSIEVDPAEDDLYDLVIGVAEGRVSRAAVAVFFEQHAG